MGNKILDNLLDGKNMYYAHTKKGGSKESLSAHLNLTMYYFEILNENLKIKDRVDVILKRMYQGISDTVLEIAFEIYKMAIYYHDIGKINPLFQENKMENIVYNKEYELTSNHSMLSSMLFIDSLVEDISKNKNITANKDKFFLIYLTLVFGYIISRHHSPLSNLSDYLEKYLEEINNYELYDIYPMKQKGLVKRFLNMQKWGDFIENFNISKESIYALGKMLFMCVIDCDYYATYEYMNGKKVSIKKIKNRNLFNKYKNSKLAKKIRKYEQDRNNISGIEPINVLRNNIFLEVEKNLLENLDKNIFYLEAPTGAGKTNIAINIARIFYESIPEIKSINYIFPFNNLIEQTANTFGEYFIKEGEDKEYIVVNSITPVLTDKEIENLEKNEDANYNDVYLKSEFRQYPIVITSHVNMFNTFFGKGKEANYNLENYINSVVIIDEIQSYPNKVWRNFITMLDYYAYFYNIKFVIMSATLPRLDKLLDYSSNTYCNLIENPEKYKKHDKFKNRVKIDFSLLKLNIDLAILANKVVEHKGKKILVEFITKKTARDFYNLVKDKFDNVYELTGDDNNLTRKEVIENIRKLNDVLVIATQTIEAGVDIDMDIGFKNISILDSEEQFLGRINRSSKKEYECIAYFFKIDDPNVIYRGDSRLEYTLEKVENQEILLNKNFDEYYEKVMNKTYEKTNKNNSNNIINLYKSCGNLEYDYIEKIMELIDTKNVQIFLNYTINDNGKEIVGEKIWEEYKKLCLNTEMLYSKKQIELSRIKEKLSLFTYNIAGNDKNSEPSCYNEKFGNIYYYENGEEFIEDGKFDREKFNRQGGGMFL